MIITVKKRTSINIWEINLNNCLSFFLSLSKSKIALIKKKRKKKEEETSKEGGAGGPQQRPKPERTGERRNYLCPSGEMAR
jgi:hypothetical protein